MDTRSKTNAVVAGCALGRGRDRVTLPEKPKFCIGTSEHLTERERDVLRLLAHGCSYGQVSDRLGVSMNTIATHIKNLYRKLGVHSARQAIWRALELQLPLETGPDQPTSSYLQPRAEHGRACVPQ